MSDRKDTNPKDAIGIAKVPASTVPREVIAEVGLAMMEGALKYGRHNYREAGVRASVYFDAATRHLDAWYEGQDIDPDSGLSHLVKAIACLVVIRDSQFRENWTDDRPPKLPDNWQADLNVKAAALLGRYPNPLPAHTQLAATPTVPGVWQSLSDVPVGVRVTYPGAQDTICVISKDHAWYVMADMPFPAEGGWKISGNRTIDRCAPFTEVLEQT